MLTDLATYDKLLASVRAHRKSILVVGDRIKDIYVYGSLTRMAPEGGAPVFETKDVDVVFGGAENLAEQFDPWHTTVNTIARGWSSKRRLIADGRLLVVESHDEPDSWPITFTNFGAADAIAVGDYGKGAINQSQARCLVELASANRIPLIVDPTPAPSTDNDFRWADATVVKMNRDQWARRRCASPGGWLEARHIDHLVITNGPLPPTIFSRHSAAVTTGDLPCYLPVVDTAGAGDHFSAVMVMGFLHGLLWPHAAEIAHGASKMRVAYRRPRPILPAEIRGCYDPPLRKILSANEVSQLTAGKKVVFTNGRFRMGLTAGHCSMLEFAKAQGEVLVVGVNSGASISRIAPHERIGESVWSNGIAAMHTEQRAYMLASHSAVDFVVVYDEDTPVETMKALGPIDTLVKGDEYVGTEVPGSNLASRVLFAPTRFPEHTSDWEALRTQDVPVRS